MVMCGGRAADSPLPWLVTVLVLVHHCRADPLGNKGP